MTVLIASFLLALLFLNRRPGGYMEERDYAAEIGRMTRDISEGDDIIICGVYKPLRNGVKGEVAIYRAGKSSGNDSTPASEVGKSKPFFLAERAVTQNYSLPKDIYAEMKLFSEKLKDYISSEKKADVIINLSMMEGFPDKI